MMCQMFVILRILLYRCRYKNAKYATTKQIWTFNWMVVIIRFACNVLMIFFVFWSTITQCTLSNVPNTAAKSSQLILKLKEFSAPKTSLNTKNNRKIKLLAVIKICFSVRNLIARQSWTQKIKKGGRLNVRLVSLWCVSTVNITTMALHFAKTLLIKD